MPFPVIAVELPGWIDDYVADRGRRFDTREERMDFTIGLAARNVEHGTGGPFGAAVFEAETGELVAPGVNLVVPASVAVAHAEIIAIALAGRVRGTFDLGAEGPTELYASTEPCAMCFGSVPWSGVSTLLCAARDEDARAVGFDDRRNPNRGLELRPREVLKRAQGGVRQSAGRSSGSSLLTASSRSARANGLDSVESAPMNRAVSR